MTSLAPTLVPDRWILNKYVLNKQKTNKTKKHRIEMQCFIIRSNINETEEKKPFQEESETE